MQIDFLKNKTTLAKKYNKLAKDKSVNDNLSRLRLSSSIGVVEYQVP